MYQQSFSIGGESALRLQLSGDGDLHLIGVEESYLRLQGEGDEDDYRAEYQSGVLTLALRDDCVLYVPHALNLNVTGSMGKLKASDLSGDLNVEGCRDNASLKGTTGALRIGEVGGNLRVLEAGSLAAGAVRGDATIADVADDVSLDSVAGDLILRAAHTVRAGNVHGDLRAAEVGGDFHAGRVGGDVKLESVGGSVELGEVHGDVRLMEVGGTVSAVSAGGDIYLDGALSPEANQAFNAGGDVTLVLPPDTNATLLCAAGGDIVNRFSADKPRRSGGSAQITLGQGGTQVNVRAGGDIKLKPREGEAMEFRIEINKEEMKRVKEEMKRAKEEMKRIKREIREQVRQHGHEARRSVAEDVARAFRHEMHFDFTPPTPPNPPTPPTPPTPPRAHRRMRFGFDFGGRGSGEQTPVADAPPERQRPSEEERLEILKMLEKKSITPEQAEMLLNALGDE